MFEGDIPETLRSLELNLMETKQDRKRKTISVRKSRTVLHR